MRFFSILSMAAALALPAAAADVQVLEEIIAKINGEIVTRSELDRSAAEIRMELERQNLTGQQLDAAVAERQKEVLRDLIDTSLLVQRAKELNVNADAEVVKYIDNMRRQYKVATLEEFEKFVTEKGGIHFEDFKDQARNRILTQRVIQQEVGHKINISKEEIQKYYEEHKQEFVRPEEVHLRQILISSEGKEPKDLPAVDKKAQDILARVKKGERFPELASKVSDDKESAESGGDIGWWKRGLLDKQIEDMVFSAKRGFTSELIKRPNGYLILKVEDRHQAGQAALEDVEPEIQERLYGPKMDPALRAYLTKLRQSAFIEIRPGFVDTGAVPGQDTTWKDPEQYKPAVTTKSELAQKKRKRLLFVVPRRGGSKSKDSSTVDTAPAPAPKEPAKDSEKPAQP